MDLVVDANILFAVLIKESFSHYILFSDKFHLHSPEYVFIEFEKHKEEILNKTKRTNEDFFKLIEILKRRINLIPLEELENYAELAQSISPDPDDAVYFALALKLKCGIWSNDKKLKEQNVVKIYSTEEIKELF